MRSRVAALVSSFLLVACAGPRQALEERDGRPCNYPDVPVPAGYVLLNDLDPSTPSPHYLMYMCPPTTALNEDAVFAFFSAELPKHGWTDVAVDNERGLVSGKKPGVGQRPGEGVYVQTRIGVSASPETRATMEGAGVGPGSVVARSFLLTRG